MILLVTSGLKAQNQVFFPVDSIPGITIKLDDDNKEDTVVVVTAPVATETQAKILERKWSNLEKGLKEIMQSPEMLSNNITGEIRYIYKIEDIPCYGELYLCLSLKDNLNLKEYVLSRTNPLVDELDITSAINITSCRTGSDDGVNINTPEGQIPRRIPRRKK